MATTIEVVNQAVNAALTALRNKLGDMSPVLLAIGEDMVERIKGRFGTTTGPDGSRWAPNSQVTLIRYLEKKGGFSKKTGKITAKGQTLAIAKRPLQGESGDLARQVFRQVFSGNELMVGSNMVYAAMQQFGGTKSQFPNLWGDIPARPFFPITPDGKLYPAEADLIVGRVRQYLEG